MVRPDVAPGMEERDDVSTLGVDTGEVWPLVEVAAVAGQGEIRRVVWASVLLRHDVLDVMREPALFLAEQAVLVAILRSLADELPSGSIHQAEPFRSRERRAFIWRVAMKSSALM